MTQNDEDANENIQEDQGQDFMDRNDTSQQTRTIRNETEEEMLNVRQRSSSYDRRKPAYNEDYKCSACNARA